jgi:hypothetical protein
MKACTDISLFRDIGEDEKGGFITYLISYLRDSQVTLQPGAEICAAIVYVACLMLASEI